MKRKYYPYQMWEEVDYGMYANVNNNFDQLVKKAKNLLQSPATLKHYMLRTIEEWPNSTERNLTTPSRNKQAWLGQAACCLFANVPEDATKTAWSLLSDAQKEEANLIADEVYAHWRKNYVKNI